MARSPTDCCYDGIEIFFSSQTTLEDVLVCDLVLMALLTFLFLSLTTEHVFFQSFLCVLRVLAVFGLNATLIFFVNNNNNNNNK